jgi:asparagine synthase (glutamine-hydrolysing)
MCGIAGYWGSGDRDVLERMGASLSHRGPDEGGVYVEGSLGLAHRRLSILDLSPTGSQPMTTADRDVWIVFNGEIYNYQKLRIELAEYSFRGSSDTEVILYLYKKYGKAFLQKLEGMFAIALYDVKKNVLILARDSLGKKPLYWTLRHGTLVFGSEIKALREHPSCSSELNIDALAQYLIYEYVPSPQTIYTDIHKLVPGTYLVFDGKTHVIQTYTQNIFSDNEAYTFEKQIDVLDTLISESVRKRLVADVPVGVFLSGGLDSSTVAYYAQQHREERIKTFSIGFEDESFNESNHARTVAHALGTDHYERVVTPKDLMSVIHELPMVLDEPMADSSIIPSLLLSQFAREKVKVALSGDGADELFLGYSTFFAHVLGMYYERIPYNIHRIIQRASAHIPVSHEYMSFDFKLKKFLSGFDAVRSRRNTYWLSAFTYAELEKVFVPNLNEDRVLHPTDRFYKLYPNFWTALQMEYVQGYLVDDILVKADRASMARSLEVRSPFLDESIVRFANTLPIRQKLKGTKGKYILKKLMHAKLPPCATARKKQGFNIPIGHWIQHELKGVFSDTMLSGKLVSSGLFRKTELERLLSEHVAGKVDHRKKIWTLFVLALWLERWS